MTDKKELSQQEEAFLSYLFDGKEIRHPDEAKRMAGYAKDYPVDKIIKNIHQTMLDTFDRSLAIYIPEAMLGLVEIMRDPSIPGAKVKLQAIQDLLDRAGIVKKEKTEIQQAPQHFMFVLPSKDIIKE